MKYKVILLSLLVVTGTLFLTTGFDLESYKTPSTEKVGSAAIRTLEAATYVNPYSKEGKAIGGITMDETWTMFLVSFIFLLIVILALLIILQIKLNGYLEKLKVREVGAENFVERASWWEIFVKVEKDRPLDAPIAGHNYDGIVELDNNPPSWFNWLFFLPIVWGIFYVLYYHVFSIGALPAKEYEMAMVEHNAIIAKVEEMHATDFENLIPVTEAAELDLGKQIFVTRCAACHSENGGGGVGPNLTDAYWLHGGDFKSVYKTIYNGVDGKGMQAWGKELPYKDIVQVASYIETIKNTQVEGGKEPQGDLYSAE